MKITIDVDTLLPGADWQRLETWAALAGMSLADYISACVRRGHRELRAEVAESTLYLRPSGEEAAPAR